MLEPIKLNKVMATGFKSQIPYEMRDFFMFVKEERNVFVIIIFVYLIGIENVFTK